MRIGIRVIVSGVVTQKMSAFKTITIATKIQEVKTGETLTDGEALVRVLV